MKKHLICIEMTTPGFRELLVLAILVCAVASMMSIRAFITDCKSDCSIQPYVVRFALTTLVLVALLSMAILYKKRKQLYVNNLPSIHSSVALQTGHRQIHVQGIAYFLEKNAVTIGIFIFGSGGIVQHILYVAAELQCIEYFGHTNITENGSFIISQNTTVVNGGFRDDFSLLLLHSVELLFFSVQIPFLCRMNKYENIKRNASRLHHTILAIFSANIGIWVYNFLSESKLVFLYETTDWKEYPRWTNSISYACFMHLTPLHYQMTHRYEKIFMPLTLEFTLVATEILLHLWLLPCQVPTSDQLDESQVEDHEALISNYSTRLEFGGSCSSSENGNDEAPLVGARTDQQQLMEDSEDADGFVCITNTGQMYVYKPPVGQIPRNAIQKAWLNAMKLFNVYAALLIGLVDVMLYMLNLLYVTNTDHTSSDVYEANSFEKTTRLPAAVIINFCTLICTLVTIHCTLVVYSYKTIRAGTAKLSSSDVLMTCGVLGIVVVVAINCGIYVDKITDEESSEVNRILSYFSLCSKVFSAIQSICQSVLIYHGRHHVMEFTHLYNTTVQGHLSFLAMFNLLTWAKDSFVVPSLLHSRKDAVISDVLNQLFLPLCIFFRFISIALLLNVKNYFREDELKHIIIQYRGLPQNKYNAVRHVN